MQKLWIVEQRPKGSDEKWEFTVPLWGVAVGETVSHLFDDEERAQRYCDNYSIDPIPAYFSEPRPNPNEFRVRQTTEEDWRLVCDWRFRAHEWEMLQWAGVVSWFPRSHIALSKHFAHVAKSDPSKIAFVEDDAKGRADRITVMKPGRFLTKFFSDVLTPEEIGDLANRFIARSKPGTLHFAKTADEIERVYLEGPSSCMAHDASDYQSSEHPVRVYAAGDLQVAYIVRGDITARAVVWPEKKIYGRIYGDADRLRPALEKEGYTEGYLTGARLLRIEDDGYLICPYLDGDCTVRDEGDYLVIGGDIDADSTSGLIEDYRISCECCGDRINPHRDDYSYVQVDRWGNQEVYCSHCEENRTVYCEHEEITVPEDDAVDLADGTFVSKWYFNDNGAMCEGNGENYLDVDMIELADGTLWSKDYFEDHGAMCGVTGEPQPIAEMICDDELGWVHKDTEEGKRLLMEAEGQEKFDLEVA